MSTPSTHLWASKLTDFLDICNTIFFFLCPHHGLYVFLAYSLQASRDIIPFLIWLDFLPSAFSFRIPSVDNFFLLLLRPFISRLRTCAWSLFFGPQNLIPPHLTSYFSDTIRYHGPHLKKCLCVYLFSFLLFLVIYRRFGIDGTEYWLGWADTKI